MTTPASKLPVSVIGGYLGAGKTTLLNHLLRTANGMRLAVLVNDFGDVAIDADLIDSADDQVLNLAGGCVCCSIGSDLVASLGEIGDRFTDFDHVLLETSGVAMPGIVASTISLAQGVRRDAVIIVADALNGPGWLRDKYIGDTVSRQINAADLIVVSKQDLVGESAAKGFHEQLELLAPGVTQLAAANLPPASLLLDSAARSPGQAEARQFGAHPIGPAPLASGDYFSVSLSCAKPLEPQSVLNLLRRPNPFLLRAKGILHDVNNTEWVIHLAGRRTEMQQRPSDAGKQAGASQLVLIGLKPEQWAEAFLAALAKLGLKPSAGP